MKKKKLIIIIAAVVVVLAGGGAAAFFAMSGGEEEEPQEVVEVEEPPGLMELDPFVVNVTEGKKGRIAKLNISLTITPAEAVTTLSEDSLLLARMRDRTLTLLTAKAYDELVTPLGKESLRRELKARLGPLVEAAVDPEAEGPVAPEIKDVLFSEFMVQ